MFNQVQLDLINRSINSARADGEDFAIDPRHLTVVSAFVLMDVMDNYSSPDDDRAVWTQVMEVLFALTA